MMRGRSRELADEPAMGKKPTETGREAGGESVAAARGESVGKGHPPGCRGGNGRPTSLPTGPG